MRAGIGTYNYVQSTPQDTWTISHQLGTKPVHDVMVHVGGVLTKVNPSSVVHIDDDTIQITFATPETGEVTLVGGQAKEIIILPPASLPPWAPFEETFTAYSSVDDKVFDDVPSSTWYVYKDGDYGYSNWAPFVKDTVTNYWKFVDSRTGSSTYGSLPSHQGTILSVPSVGYTNTGAPAPFSFFETDLHIQTIPSNKTPFVLFGVLYSVPSFPFSSSYFTVSFKINEPYSAGSLTLFRSIVTLDMYYGDTDELIQLSNFTSFVKGDFEGTHTWRLEISAGQVVIKKNGTTFYTFTDSDIRAPFTVEETITYLEYSESTWYPFSPPAPPVENNFAPTVGLIQFGRIKVG